MKTIIKMLLVFAICGIASCKEHIEIVYNTDLGGAGNFVAINLTTKDTINISGAISLGDNLTTLTARNGNVIKLLFEPAEKYEKYNFNTTFFLHDNTEIKNSSEYNYTITDTKPGKYKVSMSAQYETDDTKLYSGGCFNLVVTE